MAGEAPKVRTLACPSCASPLTVRGLLQTESIACGACGSIIDLTDESLRIISTAQSKLRIEPLLPLGSRGVILGERLEVIGYLRRKVVVEGVAYEWGEYLLFNPYEGFRWLSEYGGHWTFIRTLIERPSTVGGLPHHLDRTFKHFQTAQASVSYVVGEFFWRVEVGESAFVEDYVAPPYMLSRESTDKEIAWSLGQYVEPAVVWKAFQPPSPAPLRVGVAPCQPAPYGATAKRVYSLFGRLLLAAIIVQVLTLFASRNQLVYSGTFTYRPTDPEKSLVTDPFDVPGHVSNVVVRSHADVSNNWIYLSLALIDEESGHTYDFGREISYYSGRDSDGAWSEGSPDDEAVLGSVPPGRYYLRIEPEGPTDAVGYSVRVYRDVPRWSFFWIAIVVLTVVPAMVFWRRSYFEIQRWAESDHPIISQGSDDD